MRSRGTEYHRPIEGFTLIELLVAIAVFAIGILGLAGLQANSLRLDQQSMVRWEASMLAYEMSDRLMSNPAGALAGSYGGTPADEPFQCVGLYAQCSAAQMADYDKAAWLSRVGTLPGGMGTITDNGGGDFTVTVRWDDKRNGATGTNCPPQSDSDLRCFEVEVSL